MLFVALIGMVILSLAGLALMRTVDTTLGVAGNVAFRHATIAPVSVAIENSINAIFKAKTLPSTTVDDPNFHYFASLQAGETKNGIPAVLAGNYATMYTAYTGAGFPAAYVDPVSGTEIRWVVERVCNFPAVTRAEIIGHCDILPPKVTSAGTDNKYKKPDLPPIPIYRVTIRADIPGTNTATHAQTFVK